MVEFSCNKFESAIRKNLGIKRFKIAFWKKSPPITSEELLKLKAFKHDSRKKITSIKGLEFAENLEAFSLSFHFGRYWPSRRSLDAQVHSLEPISRLRNLKSFRLAENENINLDWLKELPLEWLDLPKCFISDISSLGEIQSLRGLSLHGNCIKDITPIAKLDGLEYLNLAFNSITDLTPLQELRKLKFINLYDNPIKNFGTLNHLREPGSPEIKIIKQSHSTYKQDRLISLNEGISRVSRTSLIKDYSMRILRTNASEAEWLQFVAGDVSYYRDQLTKEQKAEFGNRSRWDQMLKATYSLGGIQFR